MTIPRHIAFIMDGNGRWAKKRLLPRKAGHKAGVKALARVIDACAELGVECVSFYAFSTENWKRPQDEIDALFGMVKQFADNELQTYADRNMRVRFMGDLSRLPEETRESISKVESAVAGNTGMVVNIGLNYGGRDEIAHAVARLVESGDDITVENIGKYLYTSGLPDPDIIVRSSGEERLSNFMLWQCAYSEFVFVDDYWPDFDKKTIDNIIEIYNKRSRRFGGLK